MKQISTSGLDPAASTTMRRLEQTVHVSDTVRGNAKFRETMSYIMATTENPDSPLPMYSQDIVDLSSNSEDDNESDISFESDEDEDHPGSKKNSLTRPVPASAPASASKPSSSSTTATPSTPPNPAKGITAGVTDMNLGSSPTTPRLSIASLVESLDDSPSMRYSQKASLFQGGGEQSPLQRTSTHPPNRPPNRQHHHHHHHCKHEDAETPTLEEDLGLDSPMIADDVSFLALLITPLFSGKLNPLGGGAPIKPKRNQISNKK